MLKKPFLARKTIAHFSGLFGGLASIAATIFFINEEYGKLAVIAIAFPIVLITLLEQLRVQCLKKKLRISLINDSLSDLKNDLVNTTSGNVRISLMVPSGEDSFKLAWRLPDLEGVKISSFARYYSISQNTDIYSVSKTLKPFFLNDISSKMMNLKYRNSRPDWKLLYNSIICVPINEGQKLFGILCIDCTKKMDEKTVNSVLERISKMKELKDFSKIASLYEA